MPAAVKTKPKSEVLSAETSPDYTSFVEGLSWEGKNLRVGSPKAIDKIRRKAFSASAKGDMTTCAAMFAIKSVLPRVMGPLEPAPLGNGAHSVLETFYDLPPEERTRDFITQQVPLTAVSELGEHYENDEIRTEWEKTVLDWSMRIYGLEDPTQVDVFQTELAIRGAEILPPTEDEIASAPESERAALTELRERRLKKPDYEPFYLSNGVPFIGYLDRTDRLGGSDERLFIRDYKFGGKVSKPSFMFGDQYGDQLRLYKDAVKVMKGVDVEGAELLYPRQGQRVPVDLSPGAVKATLIDFKREFDNMNSYSDTGTFPTNPGNLCGWCPAANSCPVKNVKSAKAIEHAKTMPGGSAYGAPVALGIPVVGSRPENFSAIQNGTADAFVTEPPTDPYSTTSSTGVATSSRPPRIEAVRTSPTENPMTTSILDIPPVAFPTNKWATIAATRLADAAAVHLAIHEQPTDFKTIRALTRTLSDIVEQVVRGAFLGGFDWSFDSASRGEAVVESTLRGNPAPFGEGLAAWTEWKNLVIQLSVYKLQSGAALIEKDNDESNTSGSLNFLVSNTVKTD